MKLISSIKSKIGTLSVIAASLVVVATTPMHAFAAVSNPSPAGKVSFTFDDGLSSAISQAAPTLAKYGMTGTDYVITGCVGMTTVPNTCKADEDKSYMTWAQVQQLHSSYGWEIGSHTVTHPLLASKDASMGQRRKLTTLQMVNELTKSKADLAAHGIDATSFAPPYGDYDMKVLAQIAKLYTNMRGFADTGYNTWPNNDYLLRVQQVQAGVSVDTVKSYINEAAANNQWLVLVFHNISTTPSTNPDDYEYSTRDLDQVASYVKAKNMPVVNMSDGIVKSDTNRLSNAGFDSGISDGWSTDTPAQVTKDSANNGSFPGAANSVKFTSTTKSVHLFSKQVAVDPNTTYMFKNFLNVTQVGTGEIGFYIDEYDGFGNWTSGQWKRAETSVFLENFNFSYKPTSANVAKASLQIYVTPNAGITAYVDNIQWFPLAEATPVPDPTPIPQPTDLMTNGSFDNGIADGWTTDFPDQVNLDSLSNGSPENVVNSIKMTAKSTNTHLFAPKVAVDVANTYSLSSYVNLKQINGGELAFYIDEYDTAGNWISGQYIRGITSIGAGEVKFDYTPSSASVTHASLQFIAVGNTNIEAYIDNVEWLKPLAS